jgi:5-(carboxyamino)imidazole ribonucleotide synthase
VLDLPLGDTTPHQAWSVMVNVLGGPAQGSMADRLPALMADQPGAKVHDYGKEPRPGRKVGHVTTTGPDREDALARARAAVRFFED